MALTIRVPSLLATIWVAGAVALACGGGTPEPQTAESSDAYSERPASAASDDDAPSAEGADAEPVAKRAACDDGTCTLCGDSQCPTGWYCDEGAKGGPACGWLPECAKKPTCACVKRAFPGSCEERSGGLYVKE